MYGSKTLAQEHSCNTPEIKWVGAKTEDIVSLEDASDPSMQLTKRDRVAAMSMLASQEWRDDSGEMLPGLQEAVAELRRMLMLNRKAEIQSLDENRGGVADWLTEKLRGPLCL